MRIVDRKTFLALPAGTLYAKYEPHVVEELSIKDEPRGENDWWVQDLIGWFKGPDGGHNNGSDDQFETWEKLRAGGEADLDFDATQSDGLYDDDQLFAVFSRSDVEGLIERLQRALKEGYSE